MSYLMAMLGFLLYIVMGMIKTKIKHSDKVFSYSKYLEDEILTIIASAITVFILMIGKSEIIENFLPDYSSLDLVPSAIIGYASYTIWDKIMNIIKPKKFIEK